VEPRPIGADRDEIREWMCALLKVDVVSSSHVATWSGRCASVGGPSVSAGLRLSAITAARSLGPGALPHGRATDTRCRLSPAPPACQ
jgi:hypothetical protein